MTSPFPRFIEPIFASTSFDAAVFDTVLIDGCISSFIVLFLAVPVAGVRDDRVVFPTKHSNTDQTKNIAFHQKYQK